jgi:hypothetical protein
VVFLEDAYEDMVANGRIEIKDVSKPALIPFKQDAVYLTGLIMNCYVENKNVKVTVSAGPYIESAAPNPAENGDDVTLKGISFGATKGTSKLYLGGKEIQVKSWTNMQIVFTIPDDAKSGKVKVVVKNSSSNEVQLDVGEEEPEPASFNFSRAWTDTFFPSGWGISEDSIDFTASVNGQVSNAINPKITLKDFYNSDSSKIVEVANMKRNEVVTVSGKVHMTLSTMTVSPEAPRTRYVYTYSNPKLVRYEDDVLKETYPGMDFNWVVASDGIYNDTDIYVEYSVEEKHYTRPTENDPFTYVDTSKYKIKEFHLQINVNKDVPDWGTP